MGAQAPLHSAFYHLSFHLSSGIYAGRKNLCRFAITHLGEGIITNRTYGFYKIWKQIARNIANLLIFGKIMI